MRILYFAYGSNMCTKRLYSRIGSARARGQGFVTDKTVLFNKRSADGSGKANLSFSPGRTAWGVLYEIETHDVNTLDRVEGGYDRVLVQVYRPTGDLVVAVTYVSTRLTKEPAASEWYKRLIIQGAREHNLPREYIAYLEQLPLKPKKIKSKQS